MQFHHRCFVSIDFEKVYFRMRLFRIIHEYTELSPMLHFITFFFVFAEQNTRNTHITNMTMQASINIFESGKKTQKKEIILTTTNTKWLARWPCVPTSNIC